MSGGGDNLQFYLRRLAVACSYADRRYLAQLLRLVDLLASGRFEEAIEAADTLSEPLERFGLRETVGALSSMLASRDASAQAREEAQNWFLRIKMAIQRRLFAES